MMRQHRHSFGLREWLLPARLLMLNDFARTKLRDAFDQLHGDNRGDALVAYLKQIEEHADPVILALVRDTSGEEPAI